MSDPHPYPNCSTANLAKQAMYSATILDLDPVGDDAALIAKVNGSSDFTFNFATAWFPGPEDSKIPDGLVVRVVECNPDHHPCPGVHHPEWSNAGAITINRADLPGTGPLRVDHVSYSNVTWAGTSGPKPGNVSRWGAADPRIAYRSADQTYYLTWDNCTQNCYPHRTTYLSTTRNPFDPAGWTFHGPLLPGVYTGGASLLFRDGEIIVDDLNGEETQAPHLAFVGNSDTANTLLLATSPDGLHWTQPDPEGPPFMAGRDGCWDKAGVAAGPQPEKLSSGDYLYIYNIDTGFPYHPSYLGRCAIGWAILDGSDPTKIVARSNDALILATISPWETCPQGKGYTCQEPMVVFSTGMKPLGDDEFLVFYGAADSDVGVSKIKINVDKYLVDEA